MNVFDVRKTTQIAAIDRCVEWWQQR